MLKKKAQTATEYLIILAVVIIIALIVVGVLGDVPGIGGGAGQSTNEGYWQTSKLGIPAYKFSSSLTDTDSITIRNNLASSITITRLQIGGVDINYTGSLTERTLNQGESWTYQNASTQSTVNNTLVASCPAGSSFSVDVNIEYTDVQTGAVYAFDGDGTKLEGECSV